MPEKLLIQMRASDRDPRLMGGVTIKGASFNDYFSSQGIRPLKKDLVVSCHGNTDLTLQYARQIQKLADDGNKVVVIAHGGLFFALPSLIAANAPTVPVISIPMGGDVYARVAAFLGAYVPPGTAAIGTVGTNQYEGAAQAAKTILNHSFSWVRIITNQETRGEDGKLRENLETLSVPVSAEGVTGSLAVELRSLESWNDSEGLVVYGVVPSSTDTVDKLLSLTRNQQYALWAGRPDAVPYFVAKCLAADHPDIAAKLKEAAKKKADSYLKDGKARELTLDVFVQV